VSGKPHDRKLEFRFPAPDVQRDLSLRAKAWVERHCAEQGVSVTMTDPLALAKIAEILCSAREQRDAEA
jgi:hypothetical protein